MMDWLDEVERRANAATPGPLHACQDEDIWFVSTGTHAEARSLLLASDKDATGATRFLVSSHQDEADAKFFAAARTDIPRLVALVRSQAEALRVAKEGLEASKADHRRHGADASTCDHPACRALARIDGMVKP